MRLASLQTGAVPWDSQNGFHQFHNGLMAACQGQIQWGLLIFGSYVNVGAALDQGAREILIAVLSRGV